MASARRTVAGAVLLDFGVCPLFLWNTFSASLSRELGVPTSSLSIAYSVGLAAFTAGVLVGGRIADHVAPRKIAMVCAGGVVAGLGVSAFAATLPALVLGFGGLLGSATGLGYGTAVRVAGTTGARRGVAVALVVSAYAAGAVVLAPVVDALVSSVGRTGMFAVLALALGVLLMVAAALLPAVDPQPETTSASGYDAVRPYRGPIVALWAMFLLGSAPALIAFGHAGQFAGTPELTVAAVVLLNSGNFVGRLLAGPISDRVGFMPVLHSIAAALIVACAALATSDRPALTLTALLVLGTQYGALSVLAPVALRDPVPADRFGTAWGIVFSGWGLVGLVAPVAAAWFAAVTSYSTLAAMLVGVGLAFWAAVIVGSAVIRSPR